MEATTALSTPIPPPQFEPNTEAIKRKLLKKGVYPTPKIVRNLRKKEIQKHNRKLNKIARTQQPPPLTDSQKQALAEEAHLQAIKTEYKEFTKALDARTRKEYGGSLVGKPWESIEKARFLEAAGGSREIFNGGKLRRENLRELKEIFEGNLSWVLEDDVEFEDGGFFRNDYEQEDLWDPAKRRQSERDAIRFLVEKLSKREVTVKDWKLARMMKLSGLRFSEGQLLKIVEGLGDKGKWEQALAVVEWVYKGKGRRELKSRFVYTKLLSVLGKERRPQEALNIFNLMREDSNTYPDMAAYHSIAVTLGQAGLVKELLKIIECMRQKPSKRLINMRHKNWDPILEPDVVIYNAVLNACVPSQQWKGVSWVFDQLRKNRLKPNGATYGLAMEVMLQSGKYDLLHEYFTKMSRSGVAPKALTYKVLVKAFWEEGRVKNAVQAVRDMEQRGVVGTASVYYELACCLCNSGRWQDAMLEVENMKRLRHIKPLEVTFTGMILSSLEGGHVEDCISIFNIMKDHCAPNIGTINTMLRIYSQNDLFTEAKELFEGVKGANTCGSSLTADEYTYSAMLKASAHAHQWEYFEHVYKQMVFAGCPLDQSKHASLFVEASVYGKDYLLEHAFDATLEAGEIPHLSFFTEMVLKATARQDYKRVVTLINTMAYAPFQVSERQWTDLFEKNRDRISWNCLEKLLEAFNNCDLASEVTVSNFSRSLHSLCHTGSPTNTSTVIASGTENVELNAVDGEITCCKQVDALASVARAMDGNSEPDEDKDLVGEVDIGFGKHAANHCSTNREGDKNVEVISRLQSHDSNVNATNKCTGIEILGDDAPNENCPGTELSDFKSSRSSKYDGDGECEGPGNEIDESHESNLPSADEILDAWRESRSKDGIFFPFQPGQK